eukprot:XP_011421431.1 PREDICTED: uncharacterized protein LOC105324075 [Crassostrea gigas]
MEKQDSLTLRESSEHFEGEYLYVQYLYVPELFGVQTNSIVQEKGNLAAEKSTRDSLHSNKGSQACQSGIMDFVENSNLSTLSEEVSYHCFPSLSSYDESSQLDRVSVGVTCTQS